MIVHVLALPEHLNQPHACMHSPQIHMLMHAYNPHAADPIMTSIIIIFACTLRYQLFCLLLNRALQTSSNDGYAGTVLLFHPLEDTMNYEQFEKTYRSDCCGDDGTRPLCNLFFSQRTINNGEGYVPPLVCKLVFYTDLIAMVGYAWFYRL